MQSLIPLIAAVVVAGGATMARADDMSVETPAAFQFGERLAAHDFAAICESHTTRELPVEDMRLATESHVQVDCVGFAWFGAPRFAEFVFADDALTHVWVMTAAEDLSAMRAAFEAAHGAPSHDVPGALTAWVPSAVAIRYDVPEAVYMSETAAPFFGAWFDQMAAQ